MTFAARPVNISPQMMREFFEEDKEPVFEYSEMLEKEEEKFPRVDMSLTKFAFQILSKDQRPTCIDDSVEYVSPQEFASTVRSYIKVDLGIEDQGVSINVIDNLGSIVSVSRRRKTITVKIANRPIPTQIIPSLVAHEIGTHFVRLYNDRCRHRYTWSSRKTEEGLAVLGSMFCDNDQSLRSPALRYYACTLASSLGFRDLLNALSPYIEEKEARFRYCCRAKRGMKDTSQPGAYGSDQVYLMGIVELLRNREEIDWLGLYSGVVDWQHRMGIVSAWILPPFLRDERQLVQFRAFLDQVAKANDLDT